MAVAYQLSSALQNAMADLIGSTIDTGGGPGTIKIYVGTLPSNLNPGADVLLGTLTLSSTSTGSAASGVETLASLPKTVTAVATGTAGYFIVFTQGGTAVIGGNVATSAAAMIVSTTSFITGGTISLNTGTFTNPAN